MATTGDPEVVGQSLLATLVTGRPWRIAVSSTVFLTVVAAVTELLTPQGLVRSVGAAGTVAAVGVCATAVHWEYVDRTIAFCMAVATGFATVGASLYGSALVDVVGPYGTLALASAAVIGPSWLLLGILGGTTSRFELHRDYLRHTTRVPFHTDTEVDYDDVEVVIRHPDAGDRLVGAASYTIVRSGAPNVSVRSIADPETFERTLNTRVTDPHRQREASDRFTNQFWYLWPEYGEMPPDPVADECALADRLGVDVDDLSLEQIQTAAEGEAVDDLTGVDSDFHGGDRSGTGDDGDGFDGGGSDYDGGGGMNYHDF